MKTNLIQMISEDITLHLGTPVEVCNFHFPDGAFRAHLTLKDLLIQRGPREVNLAEEGIIEFLSALEEDIILNDFSDQLEELQNAELGNSWLFFEPLDTRENSFDSLRIMENMHAEYGLKVTYVVKLTRLSTGWEIRGAGKTNFRVAAENLLKTARKLGYLDLTQGDPA